MAWVVFAQSLSRANSRKRPCREGSIGSEATGQGFVPSRSSSLQAPPAPPPAAYIPMPSAFGEPAAALSEHPLKLLLLWVPQPCVYVPIGLLKMSGSARRLAR